MGDLIGGFFTDLLEGIVSIIEWLVDAITDVLKFLFVPSDNLGVDLKDKIMAKFPFIAQITDVVTSFLDIGGAEEQPDYSITYYGATVKIIDFSLVEDYLPVVHMIIVAIAWATFVIKFYKRIPSIVGGYK